MGYPIVHFEFLGKDANQLQEFYSKIMGWKISSDNLMNYGLVDTDSDGKGIGGGVGESQDGSSQAVVYVEVPDLEATLKEVEAAGGKTTVPVTVIPDMVTFAQFADPAGNVVGLVQSDA